jgi:hypothetical protein
MQSKRKRVIAGRQIELLEILLNEPEALSLPQLRKKARPLYNMLRKPDHALIRDLNHLIHLRTLKIARAVDGPRLSAELDWPSEITETGFADRLKGLPRAKTHPFLRAGAGAPTEDEG